MDDVVPYDHKEFVTRKHNRSLQHPTVTIDVRKCIKSALGAIRDPKSKSDGVQIINQMLGVSLSNKILMDRPIIIVQHADMKVSDLSLNLLEMYDKCDEIDRQFKKSSKDDKDIVSTDDMMDKYFGSTLEEFLKLMKELFVLYNLDMHSGDESETARVLQINRTYLCKLLSQFKNKSNKKKTTKNRR